MRRSRRTRRRSSQLKSKGVRRRSNRLSWRSLRAKRSKSRENGSRGRGSDVPSKEGSKQGKKTRFIHFFVGKASLSHSSKGGKSRKVQLNPRLKLLSWAYFDEDAEDVRAIVRLFPDNTTKHEDFLLGLDRELDCFVPQQRPGESHPGQPYPPLYAPEKWQTSLLDGAALTASEKTNLSKVLRENFPRYEHLAASMQVPHSWAGKNTLRRYVLNHWWDGSTLVNLPAPLEVFPAAHEIHGEDDCMSWYRQITSVG
jgi:hypothetical protein